MHATNTPQRENSQHQTLRAMIEVSDSGEVKVFAIADSDVDEKRILDALRGLARPAQ